ncbi:sensor histidine kinase [Aquipuribacter nitratireducens]|uniref:histidine kinase n=1 Tax=Aquipuribacter nitratireducens TaxID=650104 RepID=A0ABW0GS51_9MICO
MTTITDIVRRHADLPDADAEWLRTLVGDWQLVSDLCFADLVLWLRDRSGGWSAVAHARPSTWATVFYDDVVGSVARPGLAERLSAVAAGGSDPAPPTAQDDAALADEQPWQVDLFPVRRRQGRALGDVVAVVVRSTDPGSTRTPGRLELVYRESGTHLLGMLAEGTYPYGSAPTGPRRGAPRVGDGLLRLDADGVVTYASPNAVSAFRRVGVVSVSGRSLAEVVTASLQERDPVDEALPLVVMGRAPWRCDLEMRGSVLSLRAVPLLRGAGAVPERVGALVLVRDVTEVRRSERALMTKDETIREIHHRVKNNLQTVSALLRMQARRTDSEQARLELREAGRRIAAIAGVYDTLAHEVDESVPFDSVVDTGLANALDLASTDGRSRVRLRREGSFGRVRAADATPLVLVLNELVSNAAEHAFPVNGSEDPRTGTVVVTAERDGDALVVHVDDDGSGVAADARPGLGTRIVENLVRTELHGTFVREARPGGGTRVTLDLRLR